MAELRQNPDGTLAIISEMTGVECGRFGGPKTVGGPGAGVSVADYRGGSCLKVGPFAGVVATTGGAIGAWTNNLGYDILIEWLNLDVTTVSTGAANVNIGQTPTSVVTSSSNLLAATSVAALGPKPNAAPLGVKVKNGEFVTLTGSADTTGMVANLYLRFVPA